MPAQSQIGNPVPGAHIPATMAGVTVLYDGETPWGESVPYVQFSREPIFYGGKWGQVAHIILSGEVAQGSYDFSKTLNAAGQWNDTLDYSEGLHNLETVRDDIITVFRRSLKTLVIVDGNGNSLEFDNVIVESVDFPNSGYWGKFSFTITLKAYEQDYFKAQGIMDAVDEFQTTENENGTVNVTHRISARGIDYNDDNGDRQNGLANAIAWVDSRKGDQYKSEEGIYKAWWGGTNVNTHTQSYADALTGVNPQGASLWTINLVLLDQEESINRLNGTYEVNESFIGYLDYEQAQPINHKNYGKRFSVDINESLTADFNVVTINGEYVGGKNTTLDELRNGYLNDGWTDSAGVFHANEPEMMLFKKAEQLSGFNGAPSAENAWAGVPDTVNPLINKPQLYNVPIGYSVEEDETNKIIKIKATYDTNSLFGENRYYFDHTVSVDSKELRNVTRVTINGELKVRGISKEKQFYYEQFLSGRDVMHFLWTAAKEQYDIISKTCWECSGNNIVKDPNVVENYWIRADIGDTDTDAGTLCADHPAYAGGNLVGVEAENCHELNNSALSLSMVKNEVKNTLSLSATFDDSDTLPIIAVNPGGGVCWQCLGNDGIISTVTVDPDGADPEQEAWDQCPEHTTQPDGTETGTIAVVACPDEGEGEVETGKNYAKADWSVSVDSPIDYVRANASGQKQYNGHWAVQNFGIKTREKSNTKVDLQFREDAGVPTDLMEITLRGQAKDIQTNLNSMLDQNDVYDTSESVSHRITKGDTVTHNLSRSYKPDDDNVICPNIDPIGDIKDCYVCVDDSGNIVGNKVYAYPGMPEVAQELCDQQATTASGALTTQDCETCWECWEADGEVVAEVYAETEAEADGKCPTNTFAMSCDLLMPTLCYQCLDENDVVLKELNTFSLEAANDICAAAEENGEINGYLLPPIECPETEAPCWTCYMDYGVGALDPQGNLFAYDEDEAIDICYGILGIGPDDLPMGTGLVVMQDCDFQGTATTTTTTTTQAP